MRPMLQRAAVHVALGTVKVVRALPSRWVLRLGDMIGSCSFYMDSRGRRVARQNLRTAFGDEISSGEIRRVTKASMRQGARAVALLLHLQPLTAERYRRWVDAPDIEHAPEFQAVRERGGVLVSGHIGNWELISGARVAYPTLPPISILVETLARQVINEVLERLRSHPDLKSAFRKGGARAMTSVVAAGGIAGMLVDRNVRRELGGVYVPFLGRDALTTPLPAWLALHFQVPMHPVFCLPQADSDRYRLWIGPDLSVGLAPGDRAARQHELLTRMNAVIEDIIRAQPELWNWTLKRFKGRPVEGLDGYPPYSRYDGEPR